MRTFTSWVLLGLTVCPCLVGANTVALIDPSFESTTNAFTAFAAGNTGAPGGWFADNQTLAQARRHDIIPGSFWGSMVNRDGNRAAGLAQYNIEPMSERGASLYQTVYLEAGLTYTLLAGVGTAKGSLNGGDGTSAAPSKCDAKFGLAFTEVPIPVSYPATPTPLALTTGVIPNMSGELVDYSVSFAPTVSGHYNIALQNRGYVPGTGADNMQSTVFFDNVRLTYIPEPSAAALLLLGGGASALIRRRRNRT